MNKKGVEKNESIITASAFSVSIEKALLHIPDAEVSIKRITNTLNSLPSNKIYISNSNGVVVFHAVVNGKQCYISSKDNKVHSLARRRYLQLLQQILELSNSVKPSDIRRRQSLLASGEINHLESVENRQSQSSEKNQSPELCYVN